VGRTREFTEEHRANIAASRRGMKFSEEHRANIAAARRGRKFTAEHRANLAAAARRRWARQRVEGPAQVVLVDGVEAAFPLTGRSNKEVGQRPV
jgi:hypothetical protein